MQEKERYNQRQILATETDSNTDRGSESWREGAKDMMKIRKKVYRPILY